MMHSNIAKMQVLGISKNLLSAMYKVLHEKILQKDINADYEKLRSASLTYYPDVLFSSMGRE